MQITVYYKITPDGLAPEHPNPSAYEEAGTIEADSVKMALALLGMPNPDVPDIDVAVRPIQVGDILVDDKGQAHIFTPTMVWARIDFDFDAEEEGPD